MTNTSRTQRVWFITGASRGIGAALTAAVLAAGDRVVATARKAESVTARFGEQPNLLAVTLDVTDEASVRAAVELAVAKLGRIDVLVNNAGFGLIGAVEEATAQEIRSIYDTNVFGLLTVTRAVLPYLRKQRSGHVINVSSVGGFRSAPGYGIYCSTKFAVEGISEALHGELAPLGVRVTVVEPDYFRTDFLDPQSVSESKTTIGDYDGTAGATRATARAVSHQQPGDPAKLAQGLIELVRSEAPPLRLAFGSDAVTIIEEKTVSVRKEMDAWRALSTSTDFTATA